MEKRQSSLSTSRKSRSRKSLLKHAGPIDEGKLAEYSSCGKKVKSRSKSRTPQTKLRNNKSIMASSGTVQDVKTSSGFSFDNMYKKNAKASATAVNQDYLHLICEKLNAHAMDRAHDISEHSTWNSEVVSFSGIADTTITALDCNVNEVAAATIIVSSDSNVKEGAKGFQNASSNVRCETSHSNKVAIPTEEKNTGAKRPQTACVDIDGSTVNTSKKLVPESRLADVIPQKHGDDASGNGCSTASAAELKAVSPNKVPISKVQNTVSRRTRNAFTRMDDARVAPNLEEISQENKLNPTKVFDIGNAGEHEQNPPKELPSTKVWNTTAKKSQKSINDMNNDALVYKTEAVPAKSLLGDLFFEDNVKD